MGTKNIDTIQSDQIAALEADVLELRTKINLVVTDATGISAKLNTLIDDLNDMNDVVMAGYTTPGSPESYGILEALDVFKDEFQDHYMRNLNWVSNSQNYITQTVEHFPVTYSTSTPSGGVPIPGGRFSPPAQGGAGGSAGSGGGTQGGNNWTANSPVLSGTGQGGNTAHSADAEDSSVTAAYSNIQKVMKIKKSSAIRAKRLARQTLNRLRK